MSERPTEGLRAAINAIVAAIPEDATIGDLDMPIGDLGRQVRVTVAQRVVFEGEMTGQEAGEMLSAHLAETFPTPVRLKITVEADG